MPQSLQSVGAALFLALGLTSLPLEAQDSPQAEMSASIPWESDYKEALKQAQREHRPIFVFFTGSDWCSWCIRLEQEVFSSPDFYQKLRGKVLFVKLDFPMNQSQDASEVSANNALKEEFGVQGFPTVVLVSPDGKAVGSLGYLAGGGARYAQNVLDLLAGG